MRLGMAITAFIFLAFTLHDASAQLWLQNACPAHYELSQTFEEGCVLRRGGARPILIIKRYCCPVTICRIGYEFTLEFRSDGDCYLFQNGFWCEIDFDIE